MSASDTLNAARLFVIWLDGHKCEKSAQTVRALIEENEQLHAALRAIANEPRSVARSPVDALGPVALTEAIRACVRAEREHCAQACDEIAVRTPVGGDIAAECAQAVRMRGVGGVAGVKPGVQSARECGLTPAKEVR